MGKWNDLEERELNNDDLQHDLNQGTLYSDGHGGYIDLNGNTYDENYNPTDQDDT